MIELAFLLYLSITLLIFIFDIFKYNRAWFDPLYVYLVFISVYVLPLSIRYLMGLGPVGNITYMYYDIESTYSFSLILTAISNFVFYVAYLYSGNAKINLNNRFLVLLNSGNIKYAAIFVFFIGAIGFILLVNLFGGFIPFLLSGYGVTERLSANPVLATSIPILFISSFLLLSAAHHDRSKKLFFIALILYTFLILVNLILGRRAEIATWCVAGVIYFSVLYKYISFKKILPIILLGFMFLNFVGIVRQSNFDSLASIVERVEEKNSSLSDSKFGLFYTLSSGQFAVPFETLPVLMHDSESVNFRYGTTLLTEGALWVPRFIWNDKPHGLTSWYYRKYYDSGAPPNEGRAFFYLSEGYLNFGLLGVLLWAFIAGLFWKCISRLLYSKGNDPHYLAIFTAVIFISNMHKLIAASSGAIFVTIPKQTIVWFLLGLMFSLIFRRKY